MPNKDTLLRKLTSKPAPVNFTMRELDALMNKCGCTRFSGGRGSGIGYIHNKSGRVLQFDRPHPGHELYRYHVNMVKKFLKETGEVP